MNAYDFTKILVNRQGDIVARFEPTASLTDVKKRIEEEI